LKIHIAPPFWRTLWFRGVVVLFIGGLFLSWYKMRTARIRAHNRQLTQHVRERTAELEAAISELKAFTYSISHDLRAPLRAIDGYTHILADEYGSKMDEEGQRISTIICKQTNKMSQLIDDLLCFSHLSQTEMQTTPVKMETVVHAVFEELTTPESRKRITFTVYHLPAALGDPALIHQIWVNLMANAIKFSSRRDQARIEVGSRTEDTRTIYHIRDNGAGFDMQYAQKLFGVFQRLHSEKEFEGTGVGLAIVQRLVQRHGGKIWAEGQENKGATFYFSLPKA
jgi:light-regulated signal transduction histidine kinase (bacteriophytochrome)